MISFCIIFDLHYLCNMIFYFSGTGNTRWAARYLAERTNEKLFFIPEELEGDCHYTLEENERIGFCFPVHGWQPPHIVREFIRRAHFESGATAYCYVLCTCGDSIGETMEIFSKALKAKRMKADSAFSLIMPESYVCLPYMYTDTPEREKEKKLQAQKDLETYARLIAEQKKGIRELVKGAAPKLYSYVIGAYFNAKMITDGPFTVDTETCIRCGICANVCPTRNITGGNGLAPGWKHDGSCTCCLACYHHCPKHAINYGKRTRKRGQYYYELNDKTK